MEHDPRHLWTPKDEPKKAIIIPSEVFRQFDDYQHLTMRTALYPMIYARPSAGTGTPQRHPMSHEPLQETVKDPVFVNYELVYQPGAYAALGLAGETGEVMELIKKGMRDQHVVDRERLTKELGDVLWYLARIADDHGIKLSDIAATNLNKLAQRKVDGTIGGEGSDR